MRVNCPECLAEHHVADDRIPDAGMSLRCRICGTRFRVARDSPDAAAGSAQIMDGDIGDDEMVCPKCFITQKKSDTCTCCGLGMPEDSWTDGRERQAQHQQQQAGSSDAEAGGTAVPGGGGCPDAEPRSAPARYTTAELFRGLFDLSFNHLITPGMIKAIYGFVLIPVVTRMIGPILAAVLGAKATH
mgnify:CR=1 FL=1